MDVKMSLGIFFFLIRQYLQKVTNTDLMIRADGSAFLTTKIHLKFMFPVIQHIYYLNTDLYPSSHPVIVFLYTNIE